MKNIILDGEHFTTVNEFHKVVKNKFEFPEYYGENLDALWDCLIDEIISEPITLEWLNFDESKKLLEDYSEKILDIFKCAEKENYDFKLIIKQ